MMTFGILLTLLGVLLLIGYFVARRRLRKQEEEGDTWLRENTDELSDSLGVPSHMTQLTPERLEKSLQMAVAITASGALIILLALF